MSVIFKCIYGPELYRIYRLISSGSVNYSGNALERYSSTIITSVSLRLKVRKSRKQFMVCSILPNYERKTILRIEIFRSFFGRAEDTIIWFRDWLTIRNFSYPVHIFFHYYFWIFRYKLHLVSASTQVLSLWHGFTDVIFSRVKA